MNTTTQGLRRGTLDKEIAIRNVAYANGSYEKEMEQTALLEETKRKL